MARILFGSNPASGHVRPGLPIARELTARGHEVVWYTGERFKASVERVGARHVGFTAGQDFDEADLDTAFPDRAAIKPGIRQLKYDLRSLFIDTIPGQLTDLRALVTHQPVGAVVADSTMLAAAFLAEERGLPWAVYGTTPLTARSAECAPMGFALPPMGGLLGRLRNGALNALVEKVVFADIHKHFQQVRHDLGLVPSDRFCFDLTVATAPVYLQGTIPEFEYPRHDLPDNVHFVGALLPDTPGDTELPDWWGELDTSRPVVLVSQGTVKIDPELLIHPAIDALTDEDVFVVVTTGGTAPDDILSRRNPGNVRVERFIPFADLLPKVDVAVLNGGYGGTQQALMHGIPVAVAGVTEGKNEVAARVAWSGSGINLKTETPTPAQIRTAVRTLLSNPSYRARAQQLQARYAEHDDVSVAATLIEQLLPADHGR
jgi:MGT family glycosyltransferase